MKIRLLSLLLLCFCLSKAQITITGTNMPVAGDTARMSLASVAQLTSSLVTNYTLAGPNFTWNFDSLKPTGQTLRKFVPAAQTPYFFFGTGFGEKIADTINIPIPSLPITLTDIYNFYKKNSTSFYVDGLGISIFGFGFPNFYSDKDELYMLPLSYGDRDSTTFKFSTLTNTALPFAYKKHGHRITEVDGWGTIKTPYGTEPCIRVVSTQYSIDTLKAQIPVGTFTLPINFGFPNYTRTYQWLTLSDRVPYLEVSGNLILNNFTPTQVRYRDNIRYFAGIKEEENSLLAISIYPNPASTQINFIMPGRGNQTIELFDALGKLVTEKKFENNFDVNQNVMDVSTLPAGLYTGKISNGKSVQNFKFIKQ